MSEYIDIQTEATDDPHTMLLRTNIALTEEEPVETYLSPEAGEEGSALAQALFEVPGLAALTIEGRSAWVTRSDDVEWHDLIEDVSDVIRDFFL